MINQLQNPYAYNQIERACVAAAGNNWDRRTNCMIALKAALNVHLDRHQMEKCCYCGLLYDRTGRGEIDHIAPKGANLYPQFTFTENNLAKSCQLCNSSTMKHYFDTIQTLDANYAQCNFHIVHPYLDDHTQHYSWRYGVLRVIISVRNNSQKARESIRLFQLDSEKRTRARAIQRNQERIETIYNISNMIRERIKDVLLFR